MMGLPDGWTDGVGLPRTARLRILGNGVVVQCAETIGLWLAELVDSDALPSVAA